MRKEREVRCEFCNRVIPNEEWYPYNEVISLKRENGVLLCIHCIMDESLLLLDEKTLMDESIMILDDIGWKLPKGWRRVQNIESATRTEPLSTKMLRVRDSQNQL